MNLLTHSYPWKESVCPFSTAVCGQKAGTRLSQTAPFQGRMRELAVGCPLFNLVKWQKAGSN